MIIGKDTNPQKQIYYISSKVIEELKLIDKENFDLLEIYNMVCSKEKISFNLYILSLDWLYILGAIKKGETGLIKCF